ncbi:myosin regulatory light chain, smooth muscle-like [Leguminivora glycinivorella]|uniref:myosin regulatory light chain, smooth muscle-like n=1 Tax=Leguminivora glycinivorella TaxID=1035111 RepID=UPI00200DCCEF|nr:myosin regulatory light chain, smooth muscle-like [Leguminivora glycinivorella]
MKEQNNEVKQENKPKGERRRSRPDDPRDEIKKFKENLLQSAATGTESILSESAGDTLSPPPPRSRSASKARESLCVPPNVLVEMDEAKLFELKEAFLLFDLDGDGCIDHSDLRGTLVSLGEQVDDKDVRGMLSEAPNPLDFDGFVNLLGYRTLELDSEETLVAALSRWDRNNSGFISEERIRHDLMTWGDRFTEKEADYALDDAPTTQIGGNTMIDYVRFCSQLCGLRKANKKEAV